jgi:predicted permease
VLDTGVDGRVLAFTAAVAMLSGLVFGLAPAANIRGIEVGTTLKQQARNLTGNSGRRWGLRHLLVVCQVALSLLLLVGAGLFVQSFRNLQTLELGYAREHVLIASMALRQRGIQGTRLAPAYNQLLDRLNATPGVLRATAATFAPLEGGGFTLPVKFVETGDAVNEQIQVTAAGPGFFEVLGIKVKSGRGIGDGDTEQSPKVVVINEALARTYFPRQSPIGRHLIVGDADGAPLEIVGVVEDVRYDGLRSRIAPTVFTAWRQDPARVRALTLIVRTTDATGAAAAALRRELRTVADLLAVTTVISLEERLDRQLGRDRLLAVVSGSFAWLALLLAAVGLYGVMAYTVARRTAEIGLRMALGAQRGAIVWLVLRETLWLVLAGIAIGIPLALAATRTVSSLLFGLDSQNALSLTLATVVMLVVSLVAAYLPARGASRVDPTIALQAE